MITSPEMYRRACRVVADLERRVKDGTATVAERERYQAGVDHVLIYGWAEDTTRAVEVIPASEPEPLHPLVGQFCDWWARVRRTAKWREDTWRVGLLYWWHPASREPLTWERECEVEAELTSRGVLSYEAREAA
jgi:hypothetical protein